MWYQFIQTRPERCFGAERIWVGEGRVSITSLERTLLDGLAMLRYCGGFGEVVYAFGEALPRVDIGRMVVDAARLGAAAAKRLVWVLETHGIENRHLDKLATLPVKGYRKLDADGPAKGIYNGRCWCAVGMWSAILVPVVRRRSESARACPGIGRWLLRSRSRSPWTSRSSGQWYSGKSCTSTASRCELRC